MNVQSLTTIDLTSKLKRIVAMWTRMAMKFGGIKESSAEYSMVIEHEHGRELEPNRERHPRICRHQANCLFASGRFKLYHKEEPSERERLRDSPLLRV